MLSDRAIAERADRVYLVARRLTVTNELLLEAFVELGAEARCVGPREALGCARPGDAVVARLDVRPTLDGPDAGIFELRRLARRGVDVLNPPAALLAAHDKLETAVRLARFAVPHPKTTHVGDGDVPRVRLPVVVKPRFGSWGRDVELCTSQGELADCLRRLRRRSWFRRQGALVQELVPPRGRDLRVVVAGGEVVGAVQRIAAPGEWRTNVALGGVRRRIDPPSDARAAALAAAAAAGADLVGVDLLPTPEGGWTVLELNGAVDFTADYSLGARDVFRRAAELLLPAARADAPAFGAALAS